MTKEEFRAARKRLDLTQKEMGREFFAAERTVQDWEAGKAKIPGAVAKLVQIRLGEQHVGK